VYEKDGVYLVVYNNTNRNGAVTSNYELFLPESHYYFNFGLLALKQANGIDWSGVASLGEAVSVMRSDLKDLFDRMIISYKRR